MTFPAFVADGAAAMAWVHSHIAQYGGDPARLFVSGHLACGYIAAMLGSDPKYLAAVGGDLLWVRGVIGISGPYDFLPLTDPAYIAIFHGANNREAMPVTHIDGKRPPMLLAWGLDDTIVGRRNIDSMEAGAEKGLQPRGNAALSRHRPCWHHPVAGAGFAGRTTLRQDMAAFIQSH